MKMLLLLVLVLAVSVVVQAAVITNVDRTKGQSGTNGPIGSFDGETDHIPMPVGGLIVNGTTQYVFSDRFFWWSTVPEELAGAEYVCTFNQDKAKSPAELDVEYRVTISAAATLWLAIDDRSVSNWTDIDPTVVTQQDAVDHVVSDLATITIPLQGY